LATALVSLVSVVSITPAAAATREVGPGQTFSTIQSCLNSAVAGDICNVHAGTYTEQLSLTSSGSSGNPITLRRNATDAVTVQSSASPVLNINGKSSWVVDGISFVYTGSGSGPSVIYHGYGSGNVNDLTFSNCTITLSSGTGDGFGMYIATSDHLSVTGTTIRILATAGSHDGADFLFASNLQFYGNTIFGNASETTGRLEDGLVVSGTNLNIENNVLHDGWSYDNHPDAIVVQGDGDRTGAKTGNVRVVRNTIYNFTQGVYFDAIHNALIGTNLIANNIIYETSAFRYGGKSGQMNCLVIDGESISGPYYTVAVGVYNNTFDCRQLHVYTLRQSNGSSIALVNNLSVSPGYTAWYLTSTGGVSVDYNYYAGGDSTPITWGSTNYSLGSFKSGTGQEAHGGSGSVALNADYTEQSSSASRDRGANMSAMFSVDRFGNPRPAGSTSWDVGAAQFSTGTAVPAPSAPTNLRLLP